MSSEFLRCAGLLCPLKSQCLRHIAKPKQWNHYFLKDPYNHEKKSCDSFWNSAELIISKSDDDNLLKRGDEMKQGPKGVKTKKKFYNAKPVKKPTGASYSKGKAVADGYGTDRKRGIPKAKVGNGGLGGGGGPGTGTGGASGNSST